MSSKEESIASAPLSPVRSSPAKPSQPTPGLGGQTSPSAPDGIPLHSHLVVPDISASEHLLRSPQKSSPSKLPASPARNRTITSLADRMSAHIPSSPSKSHIPFSPSKRPPASPSKHPGFVPVDTLTKRKTTSPQTLPSPSKGAPVVPAWTVTSPPPSPPASPFKAKRGRLDFDAETKKIEAVSELFGTPVRSLSPASGRVMTVKRGLDLGAMMQQQAEAREKKNSPMSSAASSTAPSAASSTAPSAASSAATLTPDPTPADPKSSDGAAAATTG